MVADSLADLVACLVLSLFAGFWSYRPQDTPHFEIKNMVHNKKYEKATVDSAVEFIFL